MNLRDLEERPQVCSDCCATLENANTSGAPTSPTQAPVVLSSEEMTCSACKICYQKPSPAPGWGHTRQVTPGQRSPQQSGIQVASLFGPPSPGQHWDTNQAHEAGESNSWELGMAGLALGVGEVQAAGSDTVSHLSGSAAPLRSGSDPCATDHHRCEVHDFLLVPHPCVHMVIESVETQFRCKFIDRAACPACHVHYFKTTKQKKRKHAATTARVQPELHQLGVEYDLLGAAVKKYPRRYIPDDWRIVADSPVRPSICGSCHRTLFERRSSSPQRSTTEKHADLEQAYECTIQPPSVDASPNPPGAQLQPRRVRQRSSSSSSSEDPGSDSQSGPASTASPRESESDSGSSTPPQSPGADFYAVRSALQVMPSQLLAALLPSLAPAVVRMSPAGLVYEPGAWLAAREPLSSQLRAQAARHPGEDIVVRLLVFEHTNEGGIPSPGTRKLAPVGGTLRVAIAGDAVFISVPPAITVPRGGVFPVGCRVMCLVQPMGPYQLTGCLFFLQCTQPAAEVVPEPVPVFAENVYPDLWALLGDGEANDCFNIGVGDALAGDDGGETADALRSTHVVLHKHIGAVTRATNSQDGGKDEEAPGGGSTGSAARPSREPCVLGKGIVIKRRHAGWNTTSPFNASTLLRASGSMHGVVTIAAHAAWMSMDRALRRMPAHNSDVWMLEPHCEAEKVVMVVPEFERSTTRKSDRGREASRGSRDCCTSTLEQQRVSRGQAVVLIDYGQRYSVADLSRLGQPLLRYSPPELRLQQTANCELRRMSASSAGWELAASLWLPLMSNADIVAVDRVQNKHLLRRYLRQKHAMRAAGRAENEVWAWHGTSGTPPSALYEGLHGIDPRVGSRGHYGRGAYFAENPAYCDNSFAHTTTMIIDGEPVVVRQLLLCKVLCGKVSEFGRETDSSLVRPPEGFDSVRGGPHSSYGSDATTMMRVVYDRSCAYPMFVVSYRVQGAPCTHN